MTVAEQLPESLRRLARFNSATVGRYPAFDGGIEQLIGVIAKRTGIPTHSASLPPVQPLSAPDPIADLIARLLPQIRAALSAQDWPQVARLAAYLQRNVPADRHGAIPTEVYHDAGAGVSGRAGLCRGQSRLGHRAGT